MREQGKKMGDSSERKNVKGRQIGMEMELGLPLAKTVTLTSATWKLKLEILYIGRKKTNKTTEQKKTHNNKQWSWRNKQTNQTTKQTNKTPKPLNKQKQHHRSI